jgi:hypothetical protein
VPTDASLLPVAYLGSATNSSADFDALCRFQVTAVIDSPCWENPDLPAHAICTNQTDEEDRIVAISRQLKARCPRVSTQMYLNSLMDFWWYRLHRQFEGANETQLLHDDRGRLVRVNQDGGNAGLPVFDWGQNETRRKFLAVVQQALASGISGFFLDKATASATPQPDGSYAICNHVCANVSAAVGEAWNAGHLQVMRAVEAQSPGPAIGNVGCGHAMAGCVLSGRTEKANQQSIQSLAKTIDAPGTRAVFAKFPLTTDGYAAFLMAHQQGRSWLWWYNSKPSFQGWVPEWNRTLGAPVDNATLSSAGVYSRRFSSGAVVSFDTNTDKGRFEW